MRWMVVVLLVPACSLTMSRRPPPDNAQRKHFYCTESSVPVVIDSVFAGWQAVRIGLAAAASDEDHEDAKLSRSADIVLGTTLLIIGVGSAFHGAGVAAECKQAKAQARVREENTRLRNWLHRPCTADRDCSRGYVCIAVGEGKYCNPPPQRRKPPVPPRRSDGPCVVDTDCEPGHLCVVRGREKICRPAPPPPAREEEEPLMRSREDTCVVDTDCPPGHLCVSKGREKFCQHRRSP